MRVFQDVDTTVAGAAQQTFVHLGAAQAERDSLGPEPGAGHADATSAARIENGFGETGRAGGQHLFRDTQPFKMDCALRRDELTAEFGTREFFLLSEQNPCSTPAQMDSYTRAGRSAAGDNYVIVERVIHLFGNVTSLFRVGTCPDRRAQVRALNGTVGRCSQNQPRRKMSFYFHA